jgi:hypothetical protein
MAVVSQATERFGQAPFVRVASRKVTRPDPGVSLGVKRPDPGVSLGVKRPDPGVSPGVKQRINVFPNELAATAETFDRNSTATSKHDKSDTKPCPNVVFCHKSETQPEPEPGSNLVERRVLAISSRHPAVRAAAGRSHRPKHDTSDTKPCPNVVFCHQPETKRSVSTRFTERTGSPPPDSPPCRGT